MAKAIRRPSKNSNKLLSTVNSSTEQSSKPKKSSYSEKSFQNSRQKLLQTSQTLKDDDMYLFGLGISIVGG
jgi:hypothetical protein